MPFITKSHMEKNLPVLSGNRQIVILNGKYEQDHTKDHT